MSSLTTSNPLTNSGSLDDFQLPSKPTSTPLHIDATRAEKVAVKHVAQEKGFVTTTIRELCGPNGTRVERQVRATCSGFMFKT